MDHGTISDRECQQEKRERPYFLGVVGVEACVVGACRFSHVFFGKNL